MFVYKISVISSRGQWVNHIIFWKLFQVIFKCGEDNEIESVTEPETCHYQMVFVTPYTCHPHAMLVYPTLSATSRRQWDELEGRWLNQELTLQVWRATCSTMKFSMMGLDLAPIPLTIFRSNLKFDQNLKCSGLKCAVLITTKLWQYHNSVTVLTCA